MLNNYDDFNSIMPYHFGDFGYNNQTALNTDISFNNYPPQQSYIPLNTWSTQSAGLPFSTTNAPTMTPAVLSFASTATTTSTVAPLNDAFELSSLPSVSPACFSSTVVPTVDISTTDKDSLFLTEKEWNELLNCHSETAECTNKKSSTTLKMSQSLVHKTLIFYS